MRLIVSFIMILTLVSCGAGRKESGAEEERGIEAATSAAFAFDADSAYSYVDRLAGFGARVPNSDNHRRAGDWIVEKMKGFGWEVTEQKADLKAFDGTVLKSRNIFARLNPGKDNRILLLAHWDSRPWADQDPDENRRREPVVGANDGASGVGVLMEIARSLKESGSDKGVDILFVDTEDWGTDGDDDSWALGTRYFAANPPVAGYRPAEAILLDMVGSPDARFGYEYFSQQANPALLGLIWSTALQLGHDKYFHTGPGGFVTDDHVPLIEAGIPAVDIIDYRDGGGYQGFDPVWHTTRDTMDNISRETLKAVGETVGTVIVNR